MGFRDLLGGVIESKLSHKLSNSHIQQESSPPSAAPSYNYASGPPPAPQAPYPWVPEWDGNSQRWYFLNEQTGMTSWEVPAAAPNTYNVNIGYGAPAPQQGYYAAPAPAPAPHDGYYGGSQQGGYYDQQQQIQQQQQQEADRQALTAAGAGVIGAGMTLHETGDFQRAQENLEQNAEDFPENAARWTGKKVGQAEQIPDKIENMPENAEEWADEKVEGAEQFGDDMANAYDEGKEEAEESESGSESGSGSEDEEEESEEEEEDDE